MINTAAVVLHEGKIRISDDCSCGRLKRSVSVKQIVSPQGFHALMMMCSTNQHLQMKNLNTTSSSKVLRKLLSSAQAINPPAEQQNSPHSAPRVIKSGKMALPPNPLIKATLVGRGHHENSRKIKSSVVRINVQPFSDQ